MPTMPPNIEKLPGKSHYTGYGQGRVWHIRKDGAMWRAVTTRTPYRFVHGRNLAEIGERIRVPIEEIRERIRSRQNG